MRQSPLEGKKSFIHKGHVEKTPQTLREHKIRTVSLANNHTMDHGLEGLRQTLIILRENGMKAMGAGLTAAEAAQPYVEEFKIGSRIFKLAVIAAFEYDEVYDRDHRFYAEHDRGGVNVLSNNGIKRQIEQLKRDDAFVVVFPHWGENYEWKTEPQTEFAHRLIEAGADLIVGHGAHMTQEIEKYQGRWIVYNLGNFMFNSQGRYQLLNVAPFSLAAQLRLAAKGDGWLKTVRLYPIVPTIT